MNFQFYQSFSGVVRHLIILNVLVFFATEILLPPPSEENLGRLMFAAFMPGTPYFQPWQLFTYMFMHGGFMHLAFNMLSLYFFGPMVEMVWGPKRFLTYYLACGVGAYALHMGVQWWEWETRNVFPAPMVGASGAIFGIYVAFAFNFPNQIISLLFPPISMKAKYFVIIMAAMELFYGVQGSSSRIAHFAHLGGALLGFILILVWRNRR
jgi:membrane associated rhomboid family serine protease